VEVSASKFLTAEGEQFLVSVQDITARQELEKIKQQFYAMIAHDLRTPLMSVQGSLNLLSGGLAGDMSDRAERLVASAERSIDRLIGLITNLLDFEKLQSGKFELFCKRVNVGDIITRSIEEVASLAREHALTIEAPPVDMEIHADDLRLIQVLVNLLANAIKFSPPEGLIKIGAEVTDHRLTISISDQGPGVPADQTARLFQRFSQLQESKEKAKGTGLGLAICKMIVEQHGGEIGCQSTPGQGSTFWFKLPVSRDAAGNTGLLRGGGILLGACLAVALTCPGTPAQPTWPRLSTVESCLQAWGPPDLFVTVFPAPDSKQRILGKLDLWVYAKRGVNVVFQDDLRLRLVPFYPPSGRRLMPGTTLKPGQFKAGQTQVEIEQRLGHPQEATDEQVGPYTVTRYAYKSVGGAPLSLSFLNGRLAGVSAGFRSTRADPGEEFRHVPAAPADLAPVTGKWLQSNGTNMVLNPSSRNRGFLEGHVIRQQRTPLDIYVGSFDRASGYLDFLYRWPDRTTEGHGRLMLSPDGSRLRGDTSDDSGAGYWELVRNVKDF
jgi:nitrogen-specific signal transduction histidine kinase